jgi:hypothetical protein
MKRFLIFLFLFPAIATISFYAVLYILTGAVVDSFSGPAFIYAVAMGPGVVVALLDWLIAKTPVPPVIGTTLVLYGALVLLLGWDGSTRQIFALGIIGAIPAALCSWLSI